MNGREALQTQYGFFYQILGANLDGLDADQSMKQPQPAGNCANWILGHMVQAHNRVMGLVNQEPVWADPSLDRTSDAIVSPDQALDWDTMVARLLGSKDRMMMGLGALSEAQLDEGGFSDPFGNPTTRGQLLNLMAVHQNYHAGQLGLSRRLVGLPGAIGAPEPAAEAS